MAKTQLIVSIVSLMTVAAGLAPAVAQTGTTGETDLQAATSALATLDHREAMEQGAVLEGTPLPPAPHVEDGAAALAVLAGPELDTAEAHAVLAEVPEPLQPGVERLLVGTAQAQILVDRALEDAGMADVTPEQIHRSLAAGEGWRALVQDQATGEASELSQADPVPEVPDRRVTGVDEAPFLLAQALLTDALVDAEGMLSSGSAALEPGQHAQPTAHQASPGDVVDERPYLLVSSDADTHYASGDDAILIVDVGGDDTYENAQGSPFGSQLAQVVADLAGDDTYVQTASGAAGTVDLVTQGAAVTGVGGLLDAGGDDVFHAETSYVPSDDAVATSLVAQGAASLGAGALVALGGQDCLTARATGHGAASSVLAQGAGALGAGSAVLQAQPAPRCPQTPSMEAVSDPRVIVDDGDRFEAELGPAYAVGQGAAEAGAGTFVGGPGGQSYHATADGGQARTVAQGAALTGVGLLADADGADDYRAGAHADARLSLHVEGYYSFAGATATINLGDTATLAQGAASIGVGSLLDAGTGADSFEAETSTLASASTHAETTYDGGVTEATSTVNLGDTSTIGHGAADPGVALHASTSAPEALASDDRYRLEANLDAHTSAAGIGGSSNTASSSTQTGDAAATGLGQAATGAGVIADLGGDDAYTLAATIDATADATVSPSGSASETLDEGQERTDGPASGSTGAGLLVDVGGEDAYQTGDASAQNDRCWSNSAPPTDWGLGVDVGTSPPAPDCLSS